MNYEANIKSLMNLCIKVYAERGIGWANTANTNCVRGTFGVGQLITEAVEQAEKRMLTEDEVRIGFEMDGFIAAIKAAKPSRVRETAQKFAVEKNIGKDMLETMIFECEHYNRAPVATVAGFALHNLYGIDRTGRRVAQK